jgi:serine/threonine-protein kinase
MPASLNADNKKEHVISPRSAVLSTNPGQQSQPSREAGTVPAIPSAAIEAQLEKILASNMFSESERMRRFLRLVVEEKLKGGPGRLKEFVIGVEVFDKKPPYDPRLDPIVRVEARRLRVKLREYYESLGLDDTILIELPKGSYAPTFSFRVHSAPPSPAAESTTAAGRAIAVLPFANLNPDADGDYFTDGLTEELIHALTRVQGLTVVAWNSAARLKGHQEEIGRIGEQLHVTHILRGSVRRTGERLRIAAQLVDTSSGVYLWSETYDRLARDVFAIQEEIATAIGIALKFRLSGSRLTTSEPRNLDYYKLYLKGRFYWNERTAEGMKRSLAYFDQAVQLDDRCALAYTGLADAYAILADYCLQTPFESMPRAKAAAERALELDPQSAEACTSLGFVLSQFEWRWPEAGQLYRRAIQINPGYVTAHHWFGLDYLGMLGRLDEARTELDIARLLDPLSPILLEGRGFLEILGRNYELAIEYYREVLTIDPGFYKAYTSMGRALTQLGQYNHAIEMLQKGRALSGDLPNILSALGQTHALAGNQQEADRLLAELHRLAGFRYVPSTCFAIIHLGLGDHVNALLWLERGTDAHDLPLTSLKVHPLWDPLREEPRFQALIRRLRLDDCSSAASSLP